MKRDEADGSPIITQAGFQFLLLDTASQVIISSLSESFFLYYLEIYFYVCLECTKLLHINEQSLPYKLLYIQLIRHIFL